MDSSDPPGADDLRTYARQRLEVLDAFVVAIDRRGELMQLVASALDVEDARGQLRLSFEFSDVQANAVLDLQVRRFAAQPRRHIVAEREQLRAQVSRAEQDERAGRPERPGQP